MTGLDTSQVRCLLCGSTDVEILDVETWDSGLPQPNRLVRCRCRPCDREQEWLTLIGEEATMSDSDPGSRDDPRLRPCKVRIYDTDEGPVLEHSTITQWDWDCMEFLLAEARYYAENWRGLRIAVIPELPFPWETRTQPGGDSD